MVPLVYGCFLAVRAFDTVSASWKLRLLNNPRKQIAYPCVMVESDLAVRKLLFAFGTTENPPGHVVLFPET